MSTQTQLEEAQAQVKLLEKKLSECCEKENNLLKIIGNLDSQIFSCTKNAAGEYTPVFSEGKIAEKYNFKTEQIKGKTIRELMGDEPFSRIKSYYDRAFSGETVEFNEFMFEGRYFSQTLVPLTKNKDGNITEVIGINHDITDHLQSEIENRKNIDVLNRIIEHNPFSIQILNADGYHIRENKAFLKLFKTIPDEKWSILQDPQIKESGLGKLLQHVLEGKVVKTPPVWYNAHFVDPKYPDHLVCIGSVIFPVFLSDGKLEFIVLMHEDITARKVAKEKLKESEQRLRHLLSSNPAVIYTSKVAPPYDWTFISDNVSELTGFVSGDFLNNQNFWSEHVHPDDWQKVMNELTMVLERGIHIMEYRFRCKDGHDIWILDETKLINDAQGNPLEMIGYWIDITNRKLAEIELIEARNKAEESDRLKSAFLANMSHEVRTPINGIIGFSELLTDPDFEEEDKKEFVRQIIRSGNNLLTIISDIMDISKMESGEITLRKKLINAQEFVSGVNKQFLPLTEAKNLELKLSLPDAETVIFADADRLNQIFINLMSNAIKFTEKGSVEIGYQQKGKMVEFYVKDTGIGIPAEFHDTIFESFRQVEVGNTRQYGGNGLGLAISKKLVELMDGKFRLDSEPGKGSVFYFTLPASGHI